MAYRQGHGHPDTNVLFGLAANVFLAAVATAGLPIAQAIFLGAGLIFGTFVFGWGVLSDLRAVLHPRGGIGVFFGTFNPFHIGHVALVRKALEDRGLEKVVIHPTILPRFHADALARGEIRVARIESGLQVYEKTPHADPRADYFPTGNRFYAPEERRRMIELAVKDAGLADLVEVAFYPETYRTEGFRGVFREIRRRHPGKPIHGIHGSDFGAMLVRTIMDESGWHYPFPVRRQGAISATAIRAGT
ncbi:MAG: adenylyltransferase/cytidyltransferase family protein, partial [Alphaproteobacteria bacterium]|nr:adenylyltransferase/cytidyltransferase family protein [Alphaproteobacteria bacterium]